MIPAALPAVLRYTVEVATRGHDGRPLTDVRECSGWLELLGTLANVVGEPLGLEALNPDELQIARFWRTENVTPEIGDLITVTTHNGQPLARYDVLLTCADHLVVGLHELPAFVPNPQEVPRAA